MRCKLACDRIFCEWTIRRNPDSEMERSGIELDPGGAGSENIEDISKILVLQVHKPA